MTNLLTLVCQLLGWIARSAYYWIGNLIYFICVSWFFVQAMLEQRKNETPAPMIFKKIPDYPNVQAVPD